MLTQHKFSWFSTITLASALVAMGLLSGSPASASAASATAPSPVTASGLRLVSVKTLTVNSTTVSSGPYVIYNPYSGKCMKPRGAAYPSNGDNIRLEPCNYNSGASDLWNINSITNCVSNGGAYAFCTFLLQNNYHPAYCMDADSRYYPSKHDNIQLWHCKTDHEQVWTFASETSAGSYNIENAYHPAYCMDANSNAYPSNNDNIQLWPCNDHNEQLWAPVYAVQNP